MNILLCCVERVILCVVLVFELGVFWEEYMKVILIVLVDIDVVSIVNFLFDV